MAKRRAIHVEGIQHGAPIPMGARIGNIVFSSGIGGANRKTGQTPEDPAEQAANMFDNFRAFMQEAGGTVDNIIHVKVRLKEMKYRDVVNAEWLKMFPDDHDRPARHAEQANLGQNMLMQCDIVAVLD